MQILPNIKFSEAIYMPGFHTPSLDMLKCQRNVFSILYCFVVLYISEDFKTILLIRVNVASGGMVEEGSLGIFFLGMLCLEPS